MLFGLPLAVTAFNRLPFFLQALMRRIFVLLCSFYYDDATFLKTGNLQQLIHNPWSQKSCSY